MNAVTVFARNGEARASSRNVATVFEKNHRDVLRSIDKLIGQEPTLSDAQFCAASFEQGGARQEHRCFEMNRAGFMLLVMGFTGPKALKLKIAWIAEFDRMEAELRALAANEDDSRVGLVFDIDVARRVTLMTEVRRIERTLGRKAAREHLMASGQFEHLREYAEQAEENEIRPLPCIAPPKPRSGPLWGWIDDRITVNPMVATPVKSLYLSYADWCAEKCLPPMAIQTFRAGLTNGFGKNRYQHGYGLEMKRRS